MLVLNSTIAKYSNLLTDIDVARSTGFDAMEIHSYKVDQYLAAGHSERELSAAFEDFPVVGAGWIADIERQSMRAGGPVKRSRRKCNSKIHTTLHTKLKHHCSRWFARAGAALCDQGRFR